MKDSRKDHQDKYKKLAQEYLDGWKRAKADLVNYKKEIEKHNSDVREFMAADLILELLPIHDHFKRSLEHIPDEDKKQDWVTGITHIKSQLDKFLKDRGVEEIKTIGEAFNPEFHEAVSKQESDDQESDVIIQEVNSGYTLNGKVIMPAKVIVAE